MGQKVNPIGLRLGINRTWDSRWFARKDYGELLHEDLRLRKFLTGGCSRPAVAHRHRARRQEERASPSTRRGRAWSSARRAPTSRSCAATSPR